jgi:CRP-like cAMP-binding protein
LQPSDLLLLKPALKDTFLVARQVLEEPHESISHIYFVLSGIVSVVGRAFPSHRIEVGMVGYEGMTGLAVVLGDGRSAHEMLVQSSGSALSIPAVVLRKAMSESRTLTSVMLCYAQAFMVQSSQTALANGRGVLEERLARWLLMWRDRLQDDNTGITREFLAVLLGVRRPGVTLTLHVLEGKGLIKASRNLIRIVDRAGLQKAANGFYGIPEAEYDRLIGAPLR